LVTQSIVIENKSGLHARPASNLVTAASKFKSAIFIKKGEKSFIAKSILSVMSAGIKRDTEIELICDGEDESDALKTLVSLIESGLGE